jgi:hypothetical protein
MDFPDNESQASVTTDWSAEEENLVIEDGPMENGLESKYPFL